MKMKYLLLIGTMTGSLFGLKATAIQVNFIEPLSETANVSVNFASGDWFSLLTPITVGLPEFGSFMGTLPPSTANLGSSPAGGYNYILQEFAGGAVSDILNVSWTTAQDPLSPNQFLTTFNMIFTSDVNGVILPLPTTGVNTAVPETGALQTFTVPLTAISLTVGMQSDAETIPEGGSTILMLGLSLAGTAGWKRLLQAGS
jgi:hypothetical protein